MGPADSSLPIDSRTAARPAVFGPLLGLLAVVLLAAIGAGAVPLRSLQILSMLGNWLPLVQDWITPTWTRAEEQILFQIRLPRVVLAALVGMALALAGAVYQGLFRNPMAGPYVIGVASGSGFGAVLAIFFGWQAAVLGLSAVPLAAFAGGLATMILVYNLAREGDRVPVTTLLLAGIAVGSVLAAGISMVIFFSDEMVGTIVFWLMGSLNAASWIKVKMILPYILLGCAPLFLSARALNAMLFGEESALYLGIDTERLKRVLLVSSTLLVAAAVSVSGIIGFVGLIVPHMVRLITGPDHRVLLPAAALVGAVFMVSADLAARVLIAPAQLPVGVVTALTGGPFFLYLLRRRGRGGSL